MSAHSLSLRYFFVFSMHRFTKWSLPLKFYKQKFVLVSCFLHVLLILFYYINTLIWERIHYSTDIIMRLFFILSCTKNFHIHTKRQKHNFSVTLSENDQYEWQNFILNSSDRAEFDCCLCWRAGIELNSSLRFWEMRWHYLCVLNSASMLCNFYMALCY